MAEFETPASYIYGNSYPITGNMGTPINLWVLTPEEFENIPDGTELLSIFGEKKVKGVDYIDGDTRFGYLAYGLTEDQFPTI